jgi:hypothetical protein
MCAVHECIILSLSIKGMIFSFVMLVNNIFWFRAAQEKFVLESYLLISNNTFCDAQKYTFLKFCDAQEYIHFNKNQDSNHDF